MKLLIHDLSAETLQAYFGSRFENVQVIGDDGQIEHCIGCFGCWIKTPGSCVLPDPYKDMGELLSKCDELVIISQCCYGSYSPFVKNVLDRSISYLHPYFEIRRGEMHHKKRYDKTFSIKVLFYGEDISPAEMGIAKKLVQRNALNFQSQLQVDFAKKLEESGWTI